MTRPAFGLATACLSVALVGCATDSDWSVSRMLGWDDGKTSKMPKADLATAERVENIGQKIIAQNTFTGLTPLFETIGVQESVHFHRGAGELIISEGLAKQCKTDSELAAVLCYELGQMMAEKKAAKRVGADRDSFPSVGVPTGSGMAGGTPIDPGLDAERAFRERQTKTNAASDMADAPKLARDLMRTAGFDPTDLNHIAPLLKQSDRAAAIRKQMNGSAPAPTWNR
jgi:hypothetical protein